jgi:hypothetical protein
MRVFTTVPLLLLSFYELYILFKKPNVVVYTFQNEGIHKGVLSLIASTPTTFHLNDVVNKIFLKIKGTE